MTASVKTMIRRLRSRFPWSGARKSPGASSGKNTRTGPTTEPIFNREAELETWLLEPPGEAERRQVRLNQLRWEKHLAETQYRFFTPEEAAFRTEIFNNWYRSMFDDEELDFWTHLYSQEEYDAICAELRELEAGPIFIREERTQK